MSPIKRNNTLQALFNTSKQQLETNQTGVGAQKAELSPSQIMDREMELLGDSFVFPAKIEVGTDMDLAFVEEQLSNSVPTTNTSSVLNLAIQHASNSELPGISYLKVTEESFITETTHEEKLHRLRGISYNDIDGVSVPLEDTDFDFELYNTLAAFGKEKLDAFVAANPGFEVRSSIRADVLYLDWDDAKQVGKDIGGYEVNIELKDEDGNQFGRSYYFDAHGDFLGHDFFHNRFAGENKLFDFFSATGVFKSDGETFATQEIFDTLKGISENDVDGIAKSLPVEGNNSPLNPTLRQAMVDFVTKQASNYSENHDANEQWGWNIPLFDGDHLEVDGLYHKDVPGEPVGYSIYLVMTDADGNNVSRDFLFDAHGEYLGNWFAGSSSKVPNETLDFLAKGKQENFEELRHLSTNDYGVIEVEQATIDQFGTESAALVVENDAKDQADFFIQSNPAWKSDFEQANVRFLTSQDGNLIGYSVVVPMQDEEGLDMSRDFLFDAHGDYLGSEFVGNYHP